MNCTCDITFCLLTCNVQVKKEEVDCFRPGRAIPHCHLKAKFTGDLANIPDLECHVDVLGAREPHNVFTIDISPMLGASDPSPPPTVPSTSSASTKRVVHTSQNEGAYANIIRCCNKFVLNVYVTVHSDYITFRTFFEEA